jgi:primosomal protein DnaI
VEHIGKALPFAENFRRQTHYSPEYFRRMIPRLNDLGVDDQAIRQGAILLLDLIKQDKVCGACRGYEQCGKEGDAQGHYDLLDVYNGQLTIRSTHCTPYLNYVERRGIESLNEYAEKTAEDRNFRFENFPEEQARKHPALYAAAMEFAEYFRRFQNGRGFTSSMKEFSHDLKGLYIWGPPGVGKTHLMLAVCNRLDDYGIPNLFVRADTIFDKLRMSVGAGKDMELVVEKYCTVPVLAIDEFAQERANDFTLDKMFRIINYRFSNKLPTLFTSNYEPPAVYRTFGEQTKTVEALISRIIQMTRIGRLSGRDYRLSQMDILDA